MRLISSALIASLAVVGSVQAANNSIKVVLPGSPGGNIANIAALIEPEMRKRGWDMDITITGNCANANYIYNNSSVPTATVWLAYDSMGDDKKPCYRNIPTPTELITTLYQSPEFICRLPDQPDILETKEGDTVKLSAQDIQIKSKKVIPLLEAAAGATIKTVRYSGSGGQSKGIAAKETEYVLGTIGLSLEKEGLVKCDYNTGTTPFAGTAPLGERLGVPLEMYMMVYMIGKNMDEATTSRFRADVVSSLKEPVLVDYFTKRQYQTDISFMPTEEQVKRLTNTVK